MSKKTKTEDTFKNLFEGSELSTEVKDKAVEILEAAETKHLETLSEQYDAKVKELEAEFDTKLDEAYESMIDKVNTALNTVSEKWVKDNEVAIEQGIRIDIAESFINNIKSAALEANIVIPEGKEDMVESLTNELEESESKLDESIKANLELTKKLNEIEASKILATVSEGLVLLDKEKFSKISEDVDHSDLEMYATKLNNLKESVFGISSPDSKDDGEENLLENTDNDKKESDKKTINESNKSELIKKLLNKKK